MTYTEADVCPWKLGRMVHKMRTVMIDCQAVSLSSHLDIQDYCYRQED
jgi:hypothetical protein